jgi:hypothetical protein
MFFTARRGAYPGVMQALREIRHTIPFKFLKK